MTASGPADQFNARSRQLDQTLDLLRTGRSVFLTASPGMGKTFALKELRSLILNAGDRVTAVHASAQLQNKPLGALLTAFRLPLDTDEDSLRRVIGQQTESDPLFVLVDDAHFLDSRSAVFLSQVIRSGDVTALVTVDPTHVSTGLGVPSADLMAALWLDGLVDRSVFGALDAASARSLLDWFLGGRSLTILARTDLLQKAGGIPLLIRELASMEIAGELHSSQQRVLLDIRLNSRLLDIGRRRVERLSGPDREALLLLTRLGPVQYERLMLLIGRDTLARLTQGGHLLPSQETPSAVRPHPLDSQAVLTLTEALTPALPVEMFRSVLGDARDGAPMSASEAGLVVEVWAGDEALEHAVEEWGSELVVRVLTLAAAHANTRGSAHAALGFARRATSVGPSLGAATEASKALHHLGGLEAARRATEDYRGVHSASDALEHLRWTATLSLRETSRNMSEQVQEITSQHPNDLHLETQSRLVALADEMMRGRWQQGMVMARSIIDDARVDRLVRLQASGIYGTLASLTGDCDALEYAARTAAHLDSSGRDAVEVPAALETAVGAFALIAYGSAIAAHQVPQNQAELQRLVEEALHRGDRPLLALLSAVSGVLSAGRGELHVAAGELSDADTMFRSQDDPGWRVWTRCQRAMVMVSLDRLSEAERDLASAGQIEGSDAPWSRFWRSYARLRILLARGETEDARRLSLQLAAEHSDSPTLTARLLLEAVRCGEPASDVLPLLLTESVAGSTFPAVTAMTDCVRALAQQDGGLLENAVASLNRLGLLRAGGQQDAISGALVRFRSDPLLVLSEREREVAALAAAGRANLDIAEMMFLSVRTVESHLHNAMRKVGVSSRHEFAPLFARLTAASNDG